MNSPNVNSWTCGGFFHGRVRRDISGVLAIRFFRTTNRYTSTRMLVWNRDNGKRKICKGSSFAHLVTVNAAAILRVTRSEEHTSELQSLMRISYAVFCLKKKTTTPNTINHSSLCRYKQLTIYH